MKTRLLAVLLTALAFTAISCAEEGAAEKAGKKLDEAAENAGEAVDDATDAAKDALEDAGDAIEDATDGK